MVLFRLLDSYVKFTVIIWFRGMCMLTYSLRVLVIYLVYGGCQLFIGNIFVLINLFAKITGLSLN